MAKNTRDVTVIKVEDDAVTIMHADGGGLISLAILPPDLQKRFHYDPIKAKAAIAVRAQEDAVNATMLQAEMDEADAIKMSKYQEDDAKKKLKTPRSNNWLKQVFPHM